MTISQCQTRASSGNVAPSLPRRSAVYFDCNATTPVAPEAADAATIMMRELFGNPSSAYSTGLAARRVLDESREVAARCLGVAPDEITFTSGATEAIQIAVLSAFAHLERRRGVRPHDKVRAIFGATEHKAVPQALHHWNALLGLGLEIVPVPVGPNGCLDLASLQELLPGSCLLATMAVNNETGSIADLAAIAELVRGSGALWLVDCVQALGKIPLDLRELQVDYAVFSGHKVYAPKGIGFLYARAGAPFVAHVAGGGQEAGRRSGTENLPGVAGLGRVLRELETPSDLFLDPKTIAGFRADIAATLLESFPGLQWNSPQHGGVPTCLNFSVPGYTGREILNAFDAAGVCVGNGSACGTTEVVRSHVLEAMGIPVARNEGAVRLSFGFATRAAEVRAGCEAIRRAARALQDFELQMDAPYVLWRLRHGSSNTWVFVNPAASTALIVGVVAAIHEDKLTRVLAGNGIKQVWRASGEGWCVQGNGLEVPEVSLGRDTAGFEWHVCAAPGGLVLKPRGVGSPAFLFVSQLSAMSSAECTNVLVCACVTDTDCPPIPIGACGDDGLQWIRGARDAEILLSRESLPGLLAREPAVRLIDVREAFERALLGDQALRVLGVSSENIAGSRMAQLMVTLQADSSSHGFVFICRAGTRALEIARAFRAAGVRRAWALAKGVGPLERDDFVGALTHP